MNHEHDCPLGYSGFADRIEKKLEDVIIISERVKSIDEKITVLSKQKEALHRRLDEVEEKNTKLDQANKDIRRDMKWIALIIAGIISVGKFLWGKFILLWRP